MTAPHVTPVPAASKAPKSKRFGFVALTVATFAAFVLGLAIGNADEPASAPAAAPAAVAAPAVPVVAPPTYEVAAPAVTITPFGQSFTYADHLSVTVSDVKTYQPGRYSAGHDQAVGVRMTITVQNDGSQAFDPTLFSAGASFAGAPGDRIFDSANGIGSPPQTKVLPGKSVAFPVAFSIVEGSGELQVDVAPSWNHVSAIFTGPVS